MKKIIITKPGCRELANHLWNYMSVYAYGLETGARVLNPSFSAWHQYFNLRSSFLGRLWGMVDSLYGSYVVRAHKKCALLAVNEIVHLPPKKDACDTLYCIGWFFRNPRGLERYRKEIVTAFEPREYIRREIDTALAPLRGKTLIGVQLRQKPFPGFPNGDFLVSPLRVRQIIEEYLREHALDARDVALVIVSDKNVDPLAFDGFAAQVIRADAATFLFSLARCSVVIGPNSTSSNLAAWFGNVPHIVTTNESIDWEYYRDKKIYFENKYATFAQ